ncbi:MAG: GTP-binding protein, partial [Chloroflexia bacterium]|nr:GTP-binding protein [Chloroflexia bacterium]
AGKTTLLNRILHADHGLRVAVMVNDFGSINIDSQLIVGVEGEAIALANGCICCTIRDDLLATALTLLDRADRPEYLLIEASGVSDPWAIVETFLLPELRPFFQIDGVITVVDAEYVRQHRYYEDLIVDQVSAADLVVLNKIDLVDEAQHAAITAWVRQIVPRARILPAVHGEVPLNLLLGVGRYTITLTPYPSPAHPAHDHNHAHDSACAVQHSHDHQHDHSTAFDTWSYTSARPLALKALRQALITLPEAIFRAKGVILLAEAPSRRAVLQVVGIRAHLVLTEPWGEMTPQTQLVFLSPPGALDTAALTALFDDCQTDAPPDVTLDSPQTWMREASA